MGTTSALITGAGGFIGSHLAQRLESAGWEVTAAGRRDLQDALHSEWLSRGFDYIFHLAGSANVPESIRKPVEDFDSNARLTLLLLEKIRLLSKHSKVVYVSSAAVYGEPATMPITEETPYNPLSPYAISKLASEQYMRVYANLHGLQTAVLRPFSVYGPGQRKLVVFDLLEQLRRSADELVVHGDGTQSRDFIHIDDMVSAMIAVAENGAFMGEAYNVASGLSMTIRELAELMVAISRQPRTIRYTGKARPGEPLHWEVDISKLRGVGFEPQVSVAEGLRRLIHESTPDYGLTATKL